MHGGPNIRTREVGVQFLLARPSAACVAASMILTAVATIPYVADAQAQQPNRPGAVQRAAPIQRAAPVHHVAPRVVALRPAPQVHVNVSKPTFTQQQNRDFHAANPNLQRVNPNLQRVNPNVQLNNPNVQRINPNVQKLNPNLVQQKGGLPLQGNSALKLGPGKPNFNPVLLKPGSGGVQQIKPAFPVVNFHNKFWPILKGPKFLWLGGHRRFFVPVGLLGVAFIGGSYWYPDGYVSMEGPACTGFTPDGCQLHWRTVDFEDGGGEAPSAHV